MHKAIWHCKDNQNRCCFRDTDKSFCHDLSSTIILSLASPLHNYCIRVFFFCSLPGDRVGAGRWPSSIWQWLQPSISMALFDSHIGDILSIHQIRNLDTFINHFSQYSELKNYMGDIIEYALVCIPFSYYSPINVIVTDWSRCCIAD